MAQTRTRSTILALAILGDGAASGQQMPPGITHEQHVEQMQKDEALGRRGEEAMGFDQTTTTHHFRLSSAGGSIEVGVRDLEDASTRARVRDHLKTIAQQFAAGVFDAPFATHGEQPDGVAEMVKRRRKITYSFEESPAGGQVRIETGDGKARDAVHRFLRYQIREHKTGDPMRVAK